MNMQRPKIPPKILLRLNTHILEILVPKDDDPALGDQQRQLVLLQVG